MPTYIDKTVGLVSPNLYSAAVNANLSPNEATQLQQMGFTVKKHRELKKLNPDVAKKEYDSLDPGIQEQLKVLFKDQDYSKTPESGVRQVFGVIGNTAHLFASPLIGLFKAAGQYNRAINMPYKLWQQSQQGEDVFSKKVWTDAWDGKNQFNQEALKEATAYHGEANVYVAKGLLEGKTPGEIIEAYGKIDDSILTAIKTSYDNPEEFQRVLDGVKYAQISPGRDFARMLDNKGSYNGEVSQGTRKLSGVLDFAYQIAVDPLTWITGGFSKGVTKGERLAKSITTQLNEGLSAERVIGDVFSKPALKAMWDDGIGPAIKKVAEAKTGGEKSLALDNIARNFSGWNDPEAIERLVIGKAFDAPSAQKFFEDMSNVNLLLAGRTSGLTYHRNGVAVARTNRLMSDGISRGLDKVFNNMSRTAKERDIDLEPIGKALLNNEDTLQRLANPNSDLGIVMKANAEISGWKKVGKALTNSPSGREVRIGKSAIKTIDNFTARARMLLPKELAQALAVKFLELKPNEQVVLLRNLDAATMYSMGLGGHAKGDELIATILQEKYGNLAGFATKKELLTNPAHAVHATPNLVKQDGIFYAVTSEGPIHPYQSTWAVGALPYDRIGSMVWDIKSKKNIIGGIGGATQGHHAKKIVNAWSILTLFPRLGVRSSIDETVMYMLTAPGKDVLSFVFRKGAKLSNVARAFTGSKSSTGPIRAGIQKALSFGDDAATTSPIGKRPRYSHEDALKKIDRMQALEVKAQELGVDVAQLTSLEKRQAVGDVIKDIYGPYIKDPKELDYLLEAFAYSPDALNSMSASLIAASSITGKLGEDIIADMITPSMIDDALESIGVKMSRQTRTFSASQLSERQLAIAHFEKWYKMFAGNRVELSKGHWFNPSEIFFNNNALIVGSVSKKTGKDAMGSAIDEALEEIGFKFDPLTNAWKADNQKTIDAYIEASSVTSGSQLDDLTLVRERVFRVFADMFETFNGTSSGKNDNLLQLVRDSYSELVVKANGKRPVYWNEAVARISLDEFHDATVGFRIKGEINSRIDFGKLDAENVFEKLGRDAMEMMDRQVNGLFRQPAVLVTYTALRKKWAGIEKEFIRQQVAKEVGPWAGKSQQEINRITADVEELARKRFTELAVREAADTILKFADNPNIRSNMAFSARTVGRYYRATEDFYRRIYRMKDVSLRSLYRLRLVHLGIDASGTIHNDAAGEPYVVMPMDNIIFKATNGTLGILQGKGLSGYSEPSFNEFTLKLRMSNPSFSQDAGLPTLSGPIAGLSVVGVTSLISVVPGKIPFIGGAIQPYAKHMAQGIDTFALGNIGDNMSVMKAIVPASLQRVWAAFGFDEKNRQLVTATQQAIAYNAAHGIMLDPNATDREKADYLAKIRISAHNVIIMRHVLGLFSPVAPTVMETKGIPDYIKDVGIVSIRSEFFDILNGIAKTNTGEIQDPYEVALATFIGKNPGKLIYTISREDKQTEVLIKNTKELKGWGIRNEAFIKRYGEAGYIFAPQVGEFDAASFNWIQASGLTKSKTLEKYYDDLLVARDKQSYYDIADEEKKILSTLADPQLRANVINYATTMRDALKSSNPLLESALIGGGNTIGNEVKMMATLQEIISDPSSPVPADTRLRMQLAINMVRDFMTFTSQPWLSEVDNSTLLKADRKAQIESDMNEITAGDAYVAEANRAIFKSILSSLSRQSYRSYN